MRQQNVVSRTTSALQGLAQRAQRPVANIAPVVGHLVNAAENIIHPPGTHAAINSPAPLPTAGKGYDVAGALKFAEEHVGTNAYDHMCEKSVENAYGKTGVFPSARDAYLTASHSGSLRNDPVPPAGAMVYLKGNKTYGHVALSAGDGYIYSSGIGGKYEKVKLSDMPKQWGPEGAYLGYSMPNDKTFSGGGSYDVKGSVYDTPATNENVNHDSGHPVDTGSMFGTQSATPGLEHLGDMFATPTLGATATKPVGALGINTNVASN